MDTPKGKDLKDIFHGALRSGNFGKSRIDAFSDGVFAIVITLLILEIRVPHIHDIYASRELLDGLVGLTPKFLSYILSFAYISIYWVNHHQLFHLIKFADRGLFWFNNFFLMCLAFIPFPTALIGEYPGNSTAVIFYGIVMFVTAASFGVMKWYAVEIGRLVDPQVEGQLLKSSVFKIVLGPVLYFIAILAALVSTPTAIAIYVLIPVIYFFPGKLEKLQR